MVLRPQRSAPGVAWSASGPRSEGRIPHSDTPEEDGDDDVVTAEVRSGNKALTHGDQALKTPSSHNRRGACVLSSTDNLHVAPDPAAAGTTDLAVSRVSLSWRGEGSVAGTRSGGVSAPRSLDRRDPRLGTGSKGVYMAAPAGHGSTAHLRRQRSASWTPIPGCSSSSAPIAAITWAWSTPRSRRRFSGSAGRACS